MAERATILHADLDAFYASVEQLLDPSLRGQPIAVGGGVVLAASYEAKAYGVRGGMPGRLARQLCPPLRFVGGRFRDYQDYGDRVFAICRDFTPMIERISIDEAFLDVAGSIHLFGEPADMASLIRRRVADEVGLPLSVGVARTKHLAKIASQVAKPDGLVVVEAESELDFLHRLPVELMWGVGPVTKARLADLGITTIGQLAGTARGRIDHELGKAVGTRLRMLAWNEDPRHIEASRRAGSLSAQSALGRRAAEEELITRTLRHLADRVAGRLRAKELAGRTITARVRFADLHSVTRSVTLPAAVSATPLLAGIARQLVAAALTDHPEESEISLLGIGVSGLIVERSLQLELPFELGNATAGPGTPLGAARWALDRSIDQVRTRFGRESVGYASVVLSGEGSVPDEFRELAERDL